MLIIQPCFSAMNLSTIKTSIQVRKQQRIKDWKPWFCCLIKDFASCPRELALPSWATEASYSYSLLLFGPPDTAPGVLGAVWSHQYWGSSVQQRHGCIGLSLASKVGRRLMHKDVQEAAWTGYVQPKEEHAGGALTAVCNYIMGGVTEDRASSQRCTGMKQDTRDASWNSVESAITVT